VRFALCLERDPLNPNRRAEVGEIRAVIFIEADFLIVQGEPTSATQNSLFLLTCLTPSGR
jgi:hypothetical protein